MKNTKNFLSAGIALATLLFVSVNVSAMAEEKIQSAWSQNKENTQIKQLELISYTEIKKLLKEQNKNDSFLDKQLMDGVERQLKRPMTEIEKSALQFKFGSVLSQAIKYNDTLHDDYSKQY